VYSAKVVANHLISQSPKAGTVMPAGSKVTLRLSKGPPPPRCVVPKLKGTTILTAGTLLRQAHCGLKKLTVKYSAKVPAGRVISQSPKAGTSLPNAGRVTLVVSLGRKPATHR